MQDLKDKDDDDDTEEDEIDNITVNTTIKRIDIVKSSHYNFDTYMSLVVKKLSSRPDSDFNVDDFLKDYI
jgi:hypothetical protein